MSAWVEIPAVRHETSTLPGGHVLHHSFCWCRDGDTLADQIRAALTYWPDGATSSRLDLLQARLDRIAALVSDTPNA